MNKVFKYSLIFSSILITCIGCMILGALIPKSSIQLNSEKSATYLYEEELFHPLIKEEKLTTIDNYADTILLNIVYSLDEKQPLKSVFSASYYNEDWLNVNEGYKMAVNENKEPNISYSRYWHGNMIFLKPLLMFFDIQEIRIFNAIVLAALICALGVSLIKKKQNVLLIAMVIGLLSIGVFFVPLCIEYTSTFIIMAVICLLVIHVEHRGDEKLLPIFFISGMLTCFFDFLTTETITFTMPLVIALCLRYKPGVALINGSKNNKSKRNKVNQEVKQEVNQGSNFKTGETIETNGFARKKTVITKEASNKEGSNCFKEAFNLSIKAGLLWTMAYVLMWLAKWSLSSIILKINAFEAALKQAEVRTIGNAAKSIFEQYTGAIFRNIALLFPLNFGKSYGEVILIFLGVVFLIGCIWFLYRKNKVENGWLLNLLGLIGMIPYIRYIALSNHSYLHYFFTYRAQLVTITVLIYIFFMGLDKKLINKEFSKFKRKRSK